MNRLRQYCLNWKTMYIIWFIYLLVIGTLRNNWNLFFSIIEVLFIIKIIGCCVFAISGCYWLRKKQWLNAVMFFIPICFKEIISLIYKLWNGCYALLIWTILEYQSSGYLRFSFYLILGFVQTGVIGLISNLSLNLEILSWGNYI